MWINLQLRRASRALPLTVLIGICVAGAYWLSVRDPVFAGFQADMSTTDEGWSFEFVRPASVSVYWSAASNNGQMFPIDVRFSTQPGYPPVVARSIGAGPSGTLTNPIAVTATSQGSWIDWQGEWETSVGGLTAEWVLLNGTRDSAGVHLDRVHQASPKSCVLFSRSAQGVIRALHTNVASGAFRASVGRTTLELIFPKFSVGSCSLSKAVGASLVLAAQQIRTLDIRATSQSATVGRQNGAAGVLTIGTKTMQIGQPSAIEVKGPISFSRSNGATFSWKVESATSLILNGSNVLPTRLEIMPVAVVVLVAPFVGSVLLLVGYWTLHGGRLVETSQKSSMLAAIRSALHDYPINSILAMDVDGLKRANDTNGHAFGDECLVTVRQLLEVTVKGYGEVFRPNETGDEFVVVLPGHDVEEASGIAETVRSRIEEGMSSSGMTVSIGVASSRLTRNPRDLLDVADQAAYASKMVFGKNCVTLAPLDPEVARQLAERRT